MIMKWLPIARSLDGISVQDYVPEPFRQKYQSENNRCDSAHINLKPYEQKLKATTDVAQTKFSIIRTSFGSRMDLIKANKEEDAFAIKRRAKRVRTDQGKPRLCQDLRAAIENEVKDR